MNKSPPSFVLILSSLFFSVGSVPSGQTAEGSAGRADAAFASLGSTGASISAPFTLHDKMGSLQVLDEARPLSFDNKGMLRLILSPPHERQIRGELGLRATDSGVRPREKFIAVKAYIKNEERFQINNLTFTLRHWKKGKQTKPKARRKKEIKIGAEMNDTENGRKIEEMNEINSWFVEKVNRIEKPLARLIKKKKENIQMTRIRNERQTGIPW